MSPNGPGPADPAAGADPSTGRPHFGQNCESTGISEPHLEQKAVIMTSSYQILSNDLWL
jgi:hypothetical protein